MSESATEAIRVYYDGNYLGISGPIGYSGYNLSEVTAREAWSNYYTRMRIMSHPLGYTMLTFSHLPAYPSVLYAVFSRDSRKNGKWVQYSAGYEYEKDAIARMEHAKAAHWLDIHGKEIRYEVRKIPGPSPDQ